jgi:hypothetical protein
MVKKFAKFEVGKVYKNYYGDDIVIVADSGNDYLAPLVGRHLATPELSGGEKTYCFLYDGTPYYTEPLATLIHPEIERITIEEEE